MQQMRTEKDELQRLRKIASSIAKEVKHFWDSIQKVGHILFATYNITYKFQDVNTTDHYRWV